MRHRRIFGYGSLINEESLRRTVPQARRIRPVILRGFRRAFDLDGSFLRDERNGEPAAVLNIRRRRPSDWLNGVCFEVPESEWQALVDREVRYALVEVEVEALDGDREALAASTFSVQEGEVWPWAEGSERQRWYLDLCLSGCERFGSDFVRDFRETTYIGEETVESWLKRGRDALGS